MSTLGTTSYAARPTTVAAFLAGGLVALLVGLTLDRAGLLLLATLAALLAGEGGWLALARPVVRAGPEGVAARAGWGWVRAGWPEVGAIAARPARRRIAGATLELELADRLVVLPAYRIGVDPAQAATALERLRPVSR